MMERGRIFVSAPGPFIQRTNGISLSVLFITTTTILPSLFLNEVVRNGLLLAEEIMRFARSYEF
jgi:hypothetical protein